MDAAMFRMFELGSKGYTCSQIMMILALETQSGTNPGLVRAMGGLAYGCGTSQGTCGLLSGGACVLALYAAKGADDEREDERFMPMLEEFNDWFAAVIGDQYGGIECHYIVGPDEDPRLSKQKCGSIMAETYARVMEILVSHGFDPGVGKNGL